MERKLSDSDQQIVQRVQEIAEKRGTKMAQIALAWSMAKISSPIVGANSVRLHLHSLLSGELTSGQVERLEEAMIGDLKLTEEEIQHLGEPCVVSRPE